MDQVLAESIDELKAILVRLRKEARTHDITTLSMILTASHSITDAVNDLSLVRQRLDPWENTGGDMST